MAKICFVSFLTGIMLLNLPLVIGGVIDYNRWINVAMHRRLLQRMHFHFDDENSGGRGRGRRPDGDSDDGVHHLATPGLRQGLLSAP